MKALSLKYSNPVLSQIQGCAIFLRYWVKLLRCLQEDTTYERKVPQGCKNESKKSTNPVF